MATRAAAVDALKHIRTIMNADDDGAIDRCFKHEGIVDIVDFYTQPYKYIHQWQHTVPHPTDTSLPDILVPMNRGHIRQMQTMHYWLRKMAFDNGETHLSNDSIMLLRSDEYDSLRTSPYDIDDLEDALPKVQVSAKITNAATKQKAISPLDNFKKGIKRDAAVYPIFSDMKNWDSWRRSVTAHAKAQDVYEVLDPSFIPNDAEEQELFDAKQAFMFSVFNRVIHTDTGKTIVRRNETSGDAQQIFIDLMKEATMSTAAKIDIQEKTKFLTTTKLDTTWKGTTVGFITHWTDKLRQLEDMIPVNEHFRDGAKQRMLQAAVMNVKELKQVSQIDMN